MDSADDSTPESSAAKLAALLGVPVTMHSTGGLITVLSLSAAMGFVLLAESYAVPIAVRALARDPGGVLV